jgi:hypothetical protein
MLVVVLKLKATTTSAHRSDCHAQVTAQWTNQNSRISFHRQVDMSSSKKPKASTVAQLSDQGTFAMKSYHFSFYLYTAEVQQTYSRFQGDLQNLASKIGELEQEAEEHVYVWNAPYLSMSLNVNPI